MRLATVNVLWMMCNIPILFVVFIMVFIPLQFSFVFHIFLVIILSPILFFPSTTAAFATIRDGVMDKDQPSITKSFFIYFKKNYKSSVLSGIVLTVMWFVWSIDFYYFFNTSDFILTILFILGLVLFVYTINFFSLSVHFHMTKRKLFSNTFFTTLGSPLLFFAVLISNALLFYISFKKLWFLLPFFIISISIFLSFYSFYRFTLNVEKKI